MLYSAASQSQALAQIYQRSLHEQLVLARQFSAASAVRQPTAKLPASNVACGGYSEHGARQLAQLTPGEAATCLAYQYSRPSKSGTLSSLPLVWPPSHWGGKPGDTTGLTSHLLDAGSL